MTSTVSTPRGSIVDQPRFDCRNAYVETLTPACPALVSQCPSLPANGRSTSLALSAGKLSPEVRSIRRTLWLNCGG